MDTQQTALARLTSILGTQKRVAEVFHLSQDQVSRIARGKHGVPEYMQVVLELLECVPVRDWPPRFTQSAKGE
jgi:hypothetical protein